MSDLPDESNSTRLNRLSLQRLKERFGEALNAPVLFWVCLNPGHRDVTWSGEVAACLICGLTSEMTEAWSRDVAEAERERIAKGFRAQADRYEAASKTADTMGKVWSGTEQSMRLRHFADCIEGQDLDRL